VSQHVDALAGVEEEAALLVAARGDVTERTGVGETG